MGQKSGVKFGLRFFLMDDDGPEDDNDGDSEAPAFECNPEESLLKTSTIIAHLLWMVKTLMSNLLISNLGSILT